MTRILGAASVALALGAASMQATPVAAEDLIIVEVRPVATELARHLQVGVDRIPPQVSLPDKIAAAVCETTLKELREARGGRCVAVAMSQNLIEAVRRAMRGG
jgi:hypothetical protein